MSEVTRTETLIIGTGFSGIGAAIRLQEMGINDFLLIEKESDVGGTWRDNTYPGAQCDIPSVLYSFSFDQNTDWTRRYSNQPEILEYMQNSVNKADLRERIRFNQEIQSASFDEASGTWTVSTVTGEQYEARFLISACGQLNRPAYPKLKGIENFKGEQFHSARWNHDYDLNGKRVAVVGTGASAVQFVPQVVPQAQHLTLFQRSAPYVLPKPDRAYSKLENTLFKVVPGLQRVIRNVIYAQHESRQVLFGPLKFLIAGPEFLFRQYLKFRVKDAVLREKLTPNYRLGCKRMLVANNYYPALTQPNVHVDTSGIAEIKDNSILAKDGTETEFDVIIYGTGFQATDFLAPMEIKGLNGRDLNNDWRHGAEAFKGITVSGYPNLLMLYGPNTNTGHNSALFMIESQLNYVMDYIDKVRSQNLRYMDVKPSTQNSYNKELQANLQGSVWASGCHNWYVNESGKNTNNWSDYTYRYHLQTTELDMSNYERVA